MFAHPCIRSAVKSPESPAKAGVARLARFFAGLARNAGPGKVWQARSRPGFCGNHGHKSMAFPAKEKSMPGFLGLPGQVKKSTNSWHSYVLKYLYMYFFMIIITHSYGSRIMQTCSTIL